MTIWYILTELGIEIPLNAQLIVRSGAQEPRVVPHLNWQTL